MTDVVFSTVQKYIRADSWSDWPASAGDMHSALAGNVHYIRDARGREFLFDIANDYWEQRNLIADLAWTSTVSRLRAVLERFLASVANGPAEANETS